MQTLSTVSDEGVVARRQNELAQIKAALGNFRRLSDQAITKDDDGDAVEPDLFEQLSRVAAEIAELEHTRRRRRRERALAISQRISELFPDMTGSSAALVRFGDEGLDRAAVAIQLAVEANDRLTGADEEVRAAVEKRDYGSVREHAGQAREHQAAVSAQKDILGSLLALVSDGDDGDTGSSRRPGPRHEPAGNGVEHTAARRQTEPQPGAAGTRQTKTAAESDSEVTRSEPGSAPAATVKDKPVVAEAADAAPARDNSRALTVRSNSVGANAVAERQEHVTARSGGTERKVDDTSAEAESSAAAMMRNALIIPEPFARKSRIPNSTEELNERFESARERVRARIESENQPAPRGLLTKFRRGRVSGTDMGETD